MCRYSASKRRMTHFEMLGSGFYSAVYAGGKRNRVLKISQDMSDGWLQYAKLVMHHHSHNPWAPRIHSLRYYHMDDDKTFPQFYYVATMECLDGTLAENYSMRGYAIKDQCNGFISGYKSLDEIKHLDYDLISLLIDIRHLVEKYDLGPDLHGHNIMFRGSQLVITDPLAGV